MGLVMLGLLLRVVVAWRFRVNSDEPQHLHVVWAWTQGLLPYRDIFDNHMPLFHVLSVPALLLVGERPDAVLWMRLAMLPLWGVAVLLTVEIGRTLFSPGVGWGSAVLAGLFPMFFLCSLEYRPDLLWTVLWLAAVAIAVGGTPTPRRGFALGLVLGAAAGVSLKTTLMLPAMGFATIVTLALVPGGGRPWRRIVKAGAAAAAGVLLVPGLVTLFFAAHGALEPFLYATVWHNLTPGLDGGGRSGLGVVAAFLIPLAPILARAVVRGAPTVQLGLRRAFLVLLTAGYVALLWGVWPIVTRQDMLPVFPLLAILLAAPLVRSRLSGLGPAGLVLPVVAAVEIAIVLLNPKVRLGEAHAASALVADVLRLVPPGEPVLDPKGDAVFRPRPIFWVLESVTRARLRRGLIADDFTDRLMRTRTCVVVGDGEYLPPATRRWVRQYYLPVAAYPPAGTLRVAGARLDPRRAVFDVGIATTYVLVGAPGLPHGLLDDQPFDAPRALSPGFHSYHAPAAGNRVALLWARAAEQAFSPFDAQGNWR
jgi:hypothetical protein